MPWQVSQVLRSFLALHVPGPVWTLLLSHCMEGQMRVRAAT